MGKWNSEVWIWEFEWSVDLTETEAVSLIELLSLLEQVRPQQEGCDRRRWKPHSLGLFTVKTAYGAVQNSSQEAYAIEPNMVKALKLRSLED
ncbi:hypothetical protein P8452_48544 [Trifolium repens]|nr:hypothetical protein P8452_48544 [Trifolium repens]